MLSVHVETGYVASAGSTRPEAFGWSQSSVEAPSGIEGNSCIVSSIMSLMVASFCAMRTPSSSRLDQTCGASRAAGGG